MTEPAEPGGGELQLYMPAVFARTADVPQREA
jgi:hypothetical protein